MHPSKVVPLRSAATSVAERGCSLAFGGVTLYRRPLAFALSLLQRFADSGCPRELDLWSFTAGLESDMLVGAGMVARVHACYFGLEAFGLAPHFTTAAAQGTIEIVEETEASLACGLRATLAGVGFMPSLAWIGTDLPRLRPDVRTVLDPYSGEELIAFPAVHVDVAVIHALEADEDGNALIGGNWGVDRELAVAAEHVVITAEAIVPRLSRADIPGPAVDQVVRAPHGAWPTSCHPLYPMDGLEVLRYTEAAGGESYPALLADWAAHHGLSG